MKIYLAAPYAHGPTVRYLAERIAPFGHESTSSWAQHADGQPDALPRLSQTERARLYGQNDADLRRADLVVALVAHALGKEMFCECALARLLDKPIYWVGNEELMPLSAWRPGAAILPDYHALLAVLGELTGADALERVRVSMRQL